MAGIETLKFYYNLYKNHQKGLQHSNNYQLKLYNWFPPFYPQDLWLPQFVEGRGLLKDKPNLKVGLFSICGPRWTIKYQPCDKKIFFARENLYTHKSWLDHLLEEPYIDLSIGFATIHHPQYIHIPFWIMWVFDPLDNFQSIKKKLEQQSAVSNFGYSDRRFCAFLCSHGDNARKMIYDEISSIDKVDCDGRLYHNNDTLKTIHGDNKLSYLRDYRFNLTPENSNQYGYVTEKLFEAIHAGCVPIYHGSDNRPETNILNQDAIIFIEMGKENSNAVKLVKELNTSEKRYMEFASQPRFMPGAAEVIWEYYELLEKKLKEIFKNI